MKGSKRLRKKKFNKLWKEFIEFNKSEIKNYSEQFDKIKNLFENDKN